MKICVGHWKLSELALMPYFGQKYCAVVKITILNAEKVNVMNAQMERTFHFQVSLVMRM